MKYAQALKIKTQYLYLIGRNVKNEIDNLNYIIDEVIVTPPDKSIFLYLNYFNRLKEHSLAIRPFLTQSDLNVLLFGRNTVTNVFAVLRYEDLILVN